MDQKEGSSLARDATIQLGEVLLLLQLYYLTVHDVSTLNWRACQMPHCPPENRLSSEQW